MDDEIIQKLTEVEQLALLYLAVLQQQCKSLSEEL